MTGIEKHLLQADMVIFVKDKEGILGFASFRFYDFDGTVAYLHGIVVRSSMKARGVSKLMLKKALNFRPVKILALTTQNPVMYCLLKSLSNRVYPNPVDAIFPISLRTLQVQVLSERSGQLENDKSVIRNLYSRCLYPSIPHTTNGKINQWFEESLKIVDGQTKDGFLFVAEFETLPIGK